MRVQLLSSVGFLLFAGTASAQSINSGTVTGTVSDPSAAVIAGAKVELRNAVTGYARSIVTDRRRVPLQ